MKEKIHAQFVKRFGANGTFYASAGRINLIGEHTDYNGGFVFPLRRDRRSRCILGPLRIRSMQGDHQEVRRRTEGL